MANLLDKSNKNIISSEILKENDMYASSCHTSYYGCIQLIKHILANKITPNISYKDQEDKSRSFRSDLYGGGTHNYLINEIKEKLSAIDSDKATEIFNELNDLKAMRVKADYKIDEIRVQHSINTLSKAKKIVRELKNKYNI